MPISSSHWVSYPWKNELKMQADRVISTLAEALDDDFEGEHSPLDMLERAVVLAAFSMRRMIEKRLVTDALAARTIKVCSFPAKPEAFRQPFRSKTGGNSYANYQFDSPEIIQLNLKKLADEIIHSSQLMVIGGDDGIKDGLIIASDNNLSSRLLHLTPEDFKHHVRLILDDRIRFSSDVWHPETGRVSSTRE